MGKIKERLPTRRPVGKKKPMKPVYAWAGLVDGQLCEWLSGFYDVEHLSVFRTRKHARRCCTDVRRVKIEIA